MKPRKLIDPRRDSTPAAVAEPRPRCDLPPDLLRQASGRLSVIVIMGVVLWIVGTVSYPFALPARGGGGPGLGAMVWTAGGMVVISLLLHAYPRRSKRDP